MELVDFLRARLDDAAREQQDRWTAWHNRDCESLPDGDRPTFACDCGVPARVLAEIEAKRYVIDQCAYWNERAAREAVDPPKYPQPGLDIGLLLDAMNPVLRGLALPHADHADYKASWKP